jgi:hypothetical protein
VVTRVDGGSASASPRRAILEDAGFAAGYRGLVLRSGARRVVAAARGLSPQTAIDDGYRRRGAGPRR